MGPGATVGTPGPGYPLLLSLGNSLVVIVNYALTTEQPDPCGKGPVAPRIPGVALSQNSWGPGPPAESRTSQEYRTPAGSRTRTLIHYPDPSAE